MGMAQKTVIQNGLPWVETWGPKPAAGPSALENVEPLPNRVVGSRGLSPLL